MHGGRAPGDNPYANYPVVAFDEVTTRYHINMTIADRAGVLADLASRFAEKNVSISDVRQEESGNDSHLIVVTHAALERDLHQLVEELTEHDAVLAVNSVIRLGAE